MVVVGGGGAYVILMAIGIHQQSLQVQLFIAASWGTEQSWQRKGNSLDDGMLGLSDYLFICQHYVCQNVCGLVFLCSLGNKMY